jgi:formamidopyrimidine-DNA glycosylase
VAFRLGFASGAGFALTEAGTQKRLALYLVRALDQVPGIASLGPEPLDDDFTPALLDQILHRAGRAQVKGVLRDQGIIAGIGNAYSDEILHAARLSPFKPAQALTAAERAGLYAAIRAELAQAVARSAGLAARQVKDDKRAALRVHGRAGLPCAVCGTTIAEVSFADSALQYCPGCQTGGKLLADRRLSRLLK